MNHILIYLHYVYNFYGKNCGSRYLQNQAKPLICANDHCVNNSERPVIKNLSNCESKLTENIKNKNIKQKTDRKRQQQK